MKHLKKFEQTSEQKFVRLADTPQFKGKTRFKRAIDEWGRSSNDEKILKYKKNDIVVFEPNQTPYIIKNFNELSDYQDYFLKNPIINDGGWVFEEELRDATPEEKKELQFVVDADRFNI